MSVPIAKSIKFNQIKREIKEWSLFTKFDCYSKIFQTKNFLLQLIWLGFFLLFTGLTAYFVSKNILDYYEHEVVSKIEIINEKPIEFPSITLCNSDPFTSEEAHDLISNISKTHFGKEVDALDSDEMISNVLEMTKMYVNSDYYVKRRDLAKGFSIIKCFFNNIKCDMVQDFSSYFSYMYGNCLQFNRNLTKSAKETITEGPMFGLSLVIQLDSNGILNEFSDGIGLKLFIHNKTFDNRITEEMNLKTGKETNVAIRRTFSSKTPHPYSECEDLNLFVSEYYTILKKNNKTYRQYDCFKLCLQKMVNMNCRCHYTKYLKVENLTPCQNLTQLECIYKQQNYFRDKKLTECYKQCPLECESITYDTQISSLDYPSQMTYKRYKSNMSFSSFKESLISLKVYYSFTQYTEIREVPKTLIFDLVSQIGGSLGMLLGFSIFHLIEFFEIIILINFSLFRN